VKGVRIDSESVVENFMTKSDVIRTQVDGIVKGARIVRTSYLSDGSVEMLVAMPMKGAFLNTILPERFGQGAHPAPTIPLPPPPATPDVKPLPSRQEPSKPAPPTPEKKAEPARQEP